MKVNSDLLRKLRVAKNWSQEQLAETSGLNLRTVQRIESTGKASLESVRLLGAAYDVDPGELVLEEKDGPMTPMEAIRSGFVHFGDFSGTATRFEFWWFALFVVLVAGALSLLNEALSSAFLVVMLLPLSAVGTRRLHEIGKSGWWLLYALVPFAGIIVLIFLWAMPPAHSTAEDPLPV